MEMMSREQTEKSDTIFSLGFSLSYEHSCGSCSILFYALRHRDQDIMAEGFEEAPTLLGLFVDDGDIVDGVRPRMMKNH